MKLHENSDYQNMILKNKNTRSIISLHRTDNTIACLIGGICMEDKTSDYVEMTNEEYREELNKIFSDIHENYKLRWFYRFTIEKLKSSG